MPTDIPNNEAILPQEEVTSTLPKNYKSLNFFFKKKKDSKNSTPSATPDLLNTNINDNPSANNLQGERNNNESDKTSSRPSSPHYMDLGGDQCENEPASSGRQVDSIPHTPDTSGLSPTEASSIPENMIELITPILKRSKYFVLSEFESLDDLSNHDIERFKESIEIVAHCIGELQRTKVICLNNLPSLSHLNKTTNATISSCDTEGNDWDLYDELLAETAKLDSYKIVKDGKGIVRDKMVWFSLKLSNSKYNGLESS